MRGGRRSAKVDMIRRKSDGFTLVEVLTAIAILSIVSVALLRSFTVAAKVNRTAHEMDDANALCIETAEKFSADPSPSGYLSLFNDTDMPGSYVLYYNGSFDRDKASAARIAAGNPAAPYMGVSEYKVVVTPAEVPDTADTLTEYYYPEPAFSISITNGANQLLFTKLNESECQMGSDVCETGTIIFSAINKTAMIPVLVDCSGIYAGSASSIEVTNNIGKLKDPDTGEAGEDMTAIVDFYIYNKPPGSTVTIIAQEGPATYNEISVDIERIVQYTAVIEVVRLSDNRVMARYDVDKYWVEEASS